LTCLEWTGTRGTQDDLRDRERGAYAHGVLAVVPVKGRDGAKTRLASLLSSKERTRLVFDMLERVLGACAEARAITGTLLVTPDPGFAPDGVEVLQDAGTGHADAIAAALRDERARSGVLVVMADCPLVRPESLDALAVAARPLALAPSRDGGVNALALQAINGFLPLFGVPVGKMLGAARAAGIEPAVLDDPHLALDVDTPEDYEVMLACR
jgi:2-phospho-L-lactate/phosphoenolpyruvate guanylyltransferase